MPRFRLAAFVLLSVFVLASCWDDGPTAPEPAGPAVDTTRRDTSKSDTTKKDTTRKDTSKVDTTGKVVGPAGTDSLAPGQKSKDIQLGGVPGTGNAVTWVKFQATSGHTYTFTTLPRGQATAQVFLVLDRDTLAQVSNPLVADSVVFPCLRAGTHVVRVVGPAGAKLGLKVGENSILPLYFEGADSYEPDNDTARAFAWNFKTGSSQRRTTHFVGTVDTDMIRLNLDSGTTLTVAAQGTSILPRLGRPTTTLLDASGHALPWNEKQEGVWTYASFQARTAFVRLVGSRSTDAYNVTISSAAGLPATAFLPDPFEPDTAVALAPILVADTIGLQRTLHGDVKSEDVDLVRIHADSGSLVRLRVESAVLPSVEIRSLDGIRQIARDSVPANAKGVGIWLFSCTRTADYVARIQGPSAVAYRVVASTSAGLPSWTAIPDSLEPDDTRAQAVPVARGNASFRRTVDAADVDWYSVRIDSGMVWSLALGLDSYGSEGGIEALVLDSDSAVLGSFSGGSKKPGYWGRQFHRSGKYHLRVVGRPASGQVLAKYLLQSSLETGLDVREPDSTSLRASTLVPDGKWQQRFVFPTDEDWWTIRIPASHRVTLVLERSALSVALGMDLFATGTNPTASPLLYFWPQGLVDSVQFLVKSDTALNLRVKTGDASSLFTNLSYRVRAGLEPVAIDSLEPDQTKSDARSMPLDSHWIHRNLFPGDQDWMAFDVPAYKLLHLQSSDWRPGADPSIANTIFDPEGKGVVFTWSGSEFVALAKRPGRYLVQFRADTTFRSVLDYSVRGWLEDYPDPFEPDDSRPQAKDLAMDSVWQFRKSFSNDTDWIRVPGLSRAIRTVRATISEVAGREFQIRRADGTLVKTVTASLAGKPVVVAGFDDTSTYYLMFPPSRELEGYKVQGWLTADPDTLEASDTPTDARWLGRDSIVRYSWAHDTDYFRLHVEPGHQVRIRIANVQGPEVSTAGMAGPWRGSFQPFQVAVPTDFLVRVRGYSNSTGFDRYSIRLDTLVLDTSRKYRSASLALRLPSDSVQRKLTNSYEDTVWVKIPISAKGITLKVSCGNSSGFSLFRQDSSFVGGTYNGVISGFGPPDSVVLVRIDPAQYTTGISLTEVSILAYPMSNDLFEPDSDAARARLPDASQELSGILGWDDADWFRLPDLGSASWSLESLTDTRNYMECTFYTSRGDSLANVPVRGAVSPEPVPVPAGASLGYVRLHATRALYQSLPYRIRLTKP